MSVSIRLNDELITAAKRQVKLFHRSPPPQIEHLAAIGRVMETVLSYSAQERAAGAVGRADVDAAMAVVGSPEGIARAQAVIRQTSANLVSRPL